MSISRIFFLFIIFPFFLNGQISLPLQEEPVELLNNPNVESVYTETDFSFSEVRKVEFDSFYAESDVPKDKEALWLKFKVINKNPEQSEYFLFGRIPFMTAYQQTESGWEEMNNGMLMPYSKRSFRKSKEFIPIKLDYNKDTQFYIKIRDGHWMSFTDYPVLGDKLFYLEQIQMEREFNRPFEMFSLIYFSGIIIIFIYVLLTYIMIREPLYVYYLLYLFFQLMFSFVIASRTQLWLPNFIIQDLDMGFFLAEAILFTFVSIYIQFLIELLDISRKSKIGKSLLALFWICIAFIIFYIFYGIAYPGYADRALISDHFRLFILPANFLMIIWIVVKIRHPLIWYFIVAHLFFFSGAVSSYLISLYDWDSDPNSIFHLRSNINFIFLLGLFGEAICFSFAIAFRSRLILREREKSTKNYINQLRENERIQERMNKELDRKVNQKTEELLSAYMEMEKQREKEINLEFSRKLNEMETMALRAQMNPHFIFNSMNAIKYLILTGRPEDASDYLDDFSVLLRSVLNNSQRNEITVEEELEIIQLYLSLEKARLGDDFKYKIEFDDKESLSQYLIPPLLLQPFVENAIWHGLIPSMKKEKLLHIKFDEKDSLKISIRDNGIGREASALNKAGKTKLYKSMGLDIVRNRIALFNDSNDTKIKLKIVDLKENEIPAGTLITFKYST